MSDFRLRVSIQQCCEKPQLYKGFAGAVYQSAGYNQAYSGIGDDVPDTPF